MRQIREQQAALDRAIAPLKQFREQQTAFRSLDPFRQFREQQAALDRAIAPLKQFREQQTAFRNLDSFKQIREQQAALSIALSPLRSIKINQASLLAHGGTISFVTDSSAAWREQQEASRAVLKPLAQWRSAVRDAIGMQTFPGRQAGDTGWEPDDGLSTLLDEETLRAVARYQQRLIDQTVGPVVDAMVDEADDQTLFRAAWGWATSQPWAVLHSQLEAWFKVLDWLIAGGLATAAVAGAMPAGTLLLVLAFIVCTWELLLVLTRPEDHPPD